MLSRRELERALAHLQRNDWQAAHQIVQQDEDSALSCWAHGIVHVMEGDLPNARYWYARCGRKLRKGVTPEDELREIRSALKG